MDERRSGSSSRQHSELIRLFVAGSAARAADEPAGIHRNTAATYFMRLRRLIAPHLLGYRLSGEAGAIPVESGKANAGDARMHRFNGIKPGHFYRFLKNANGASMTGTANSFQHSWLIGLSSQTLTLAGTAPKYFATSEQVNVKRL